MAYAVERGWLSVAPRLKKLKEKEPVKRTLLSAGDIKRLLKACVPKVTKNAQELGFHIRFLFLTGAREQEALKVRWQEVDLWNQQVTIGAAGDTKTGRHRAVNFTPELKGLLHEMNNTRAPDSSFLFPSPKRGERAIFPPKVCENLLSWCAPRPGCPAPVFMTSDIFSPRNA